MKTLLVILCLAALSGCDDVASLRASKDGACVIRGYDVSPNANVNFLRKRDGDHVTCTIEFEVTK